MERKLTEGTLLEKLLKLKFFVTQNTIMLQLWNYENNTECYLFSATDSIIYFLLFLLPAIFKGLCFPKHSEEVKESSGELKGAAQRDQ